MADIPYLSKHVAHAEQNGDTVLFRLKHDIDLHTSPDLRTDILAVVQKPQTRKLILNLADVSYVDSSAIAVMVEALQKLREIGGKVCLTNLNPRVKGLLEIARLDSIFVVCATEAEATAVPL